MASQVSPGVVVNEFDFSDYVERVATAIFGVVGWANKGPVNQATLVTNERQLVDSFGFPPSPPVDSTALAQAVPGQTEYRSVGLVTPALHYLREGNQCVVVRVEDKTGAASVTATRTFQNGLSVDCLRVDAITPGSWANPESTTSGGRDIKITIEDGSLGTTYFKLTVSELGVVREVFDNVTTIDDEPSDTTNFPEARINGASKYIVVTYLTAGSPGRPANQAAINFSTTGTDAAAAAASDYYNETLRDRGIDLLRDADSIDVNIIACPGVNSQITDNNLYVVREMAAAAEARGDAIALIDSPLKDNTPTLAKTFINGASPYLGGAVDSSYAAYYWPWVKVYDSHNKKEVWAPPSGLVAGIMAFNDRVAETWFAPAGFNRGKVKNAGSIQHNATLGERETLYASGQVVNPIVNFPGTGITVWGQKTTQRKNTALNRVNTRRMLNFAKKIISGSTKALVFEPNDRRTWRRFVQLVTPPLRSIKERRGLFDFRVICDETTNPPEQIDQNIMRGIILMKPTKTAEVITIDFTLLSTGAQFNEFLEG